MIYKSLLQSFIFFFLFTLQAQANSSSSNTGLPTLSDEQFTTCAVYGALYSAYQQEGYDAGLIVEATPIYCETVLEDIYSNGNIPRSSGGLPKIIEIDQTICLYPGIGCQTFRTKLRVYKCGNSICAQTLSIKRKCGLFCWEILPIPLQFDFPYEYKIHDNGWVCSDTPATADPYTEDRVCANPATGVICNTYAATGETECYNILTLEEIPQPADLPTDGFNEPAPEETIEDEPQGKISLK